MKHGRMKLHGSMELHGSMALGRMGAITHYQMHKLGSTRHMHRATVAWAHYGWVHHGTAWCLGAVIQLWVHGRVHATSRLG